MNEEIKKRPAEVEGDDEYRLPPRSTLHSSEKNRLTRIFYRSLLAFLILLTILLIGFGYMTSPLSE